MKHSDIQWFAPVLIVYNLASVKVHIHEAESGRRSAGLADSAPLPKETSQRQKGCFKVWVMTFWITGEQILGDHPWFPSFHAVAFSQLYKLIRTTCSMRGAITLTPFVSSKFGPDFLCTALSAHYDPLWLLWPLNWDVGFQAKSSWPTSH